MIAEHTVGARKKKAPQTLGAAMAATPRPGAMPVAPLVKVKNEGDTPWLMAVDPQTKTLLPLFDIAAFPVELNCPWSENNPGHVEVTLFRQTRDVFGGAELIFPCLVGGAEYKLHYELVHEGNRGGVNFRRYRKYDSGRREIISRPGVVLPPRQMDLR